MAEQDTNTKLLVVVKVFDNIADIRDDSYATRFIINQYNPEGRKKLAKCAWWAMHNDKILLTQLMDSEL